MRRKYASKNKQLGQTLIETLVAIFVLIIGLITALSLAIYSFRSSDTSTKQIVATALAREAIQGVKNIRDNNWLNDTLTTGGICAQLGSGQKCYPNWQGTGTNKLSTGTYAIDFDANTNSWIITKNPPSYTLVYNSTTGTYSSQGTGTNSVYSRKVDIIEETTAPYTSGNPRLNITATVWWFGRNCPVTTNPSTLPASCKVVLQTYLTNWKNF